MILPRIALTAASLLAALPAAAQAPGGAPDAMSCADLAAMDDQGAQSALFYIAGWRQGRASQGRPDGADAGAVDAAVAADAAQGWSTARMQAAGTPGAPVTTLTRMDAIDATAHGASTAAAGDSESSRGPADDESQSRRGEADQGEAKGDTVVTDKGDPEAAADAATDTAGAAGQAAPAAQEPGTAGAAPDARAPVPLAAAATDGGSAAPTLPAGVPADRALALCRENTALTVGQALDEAAAPRR